MIAFFNNKGGVGKTSLVYHLAWMLRDLGYTVLAADLDPQSNLTAALVDDDALASIWIEKDTDGKTIYDFLRPLQRGIGDIIEPPHIEEIDESFFLIIGDIALSQFEEDLSKQWFKGLDNQEHAFRVLSAFWRILQSGAAKANAHLVLIDMGPNLGAINRAALIASDYLLVPLVPDLFSIQGLKNMGPAVSKWQKGWRERIERNSSRDLLLPDAEIHPIGYVVIQHSAKQFRPSSASEKWEIRIPEIYADAILQEPLQDSEMSYRNDSNCLGLLKHYRSLMPMAQEARKPIFHLKPADGAIGSHMMAVRDAEKDFRMLAKEILRRCAIADID